MTEQAEQATHTDDTEIIDVVTMGVVKYDVTSAEIALLQEKYKGYEDKDMEDPAEYELVHDGERETKKLRLSIEARRKELKADALAYGKRVDSGAKEVTAPIKAIEQKLHEKRRQHDMKQEIAQREEQRLEQERIDNATEKLIAIRQSAADYMQSSVDEIDVVIGVLELEKPSDYNEFEKDIELAVREAIVSLRELRTMKNHMENAALIEKQAEEERAKQAAVEAKKVEAQKIEQQKVQDALDAQQKLVLEQQADVLRKQKEVEAEARRQEEAHRKEAEKLEAEKKRLLEAKRKEDERKEAEKQRLLEIEKQKEAEAEKFKEAQKRLAEINANLHANLTDTGCFKSAKQSSLFLDIVKNDGIPHIKFTLTD